MWKNNSLSIVIFTLFVFCLAGHSYAGWKVYNDKRRWLRQWGSPESKPVHAPHSDTGSS